MTRKSQWLVVGLVGLLTACTAAADQQEQARYLTAEPREHANLDQMPGVYALQDQTLVDEFDVVFAGLQEGLRQIDNDVRLAPEAVQTFKQHECRLYAKRIEVMGTKVERAGESRPFYTAQFNESKADDVMAQLARDSGSVEAFMRMTAMVHCLNLLEK